MSGIHRLGPNYVCGDVLALWRDENGHQRWRVEREEQKAFAQIDALVQEIQGTPRQEVSDPIHSDAPRRVQTELMSVCDFRPPGINRREQGRALPETTENQSVRA